MALRAVTVTPPKSNMPLSFKLLKTDLYHRGWTGSASE